MKYFSPATSTFILRISREHYRLAWAALSFMDRLPVKNGRPCSFRVVRVSGTIRKIEDEAIRRARLLVMAARHEMGGQNSDALGVLFGGSRDRTRGLVKVEDDQDVVESEEEGEVSDG